ncbi:MAG: single-stranded DNA-binding protein [Clostridia bacterium]|nr:single-stranded DNA-binding protein [Clostridia bacterium]
MNKMTMIGNLTRDPELRSVNTASGPVSVCDFTVAANGRRRGQNNDQGQQDDTVFIRCTAWRGLADVISRYASKGKKVYVAGPLSARTYQANDGSTRVSLEVTVEDFEFCSARGEEAGGSTGAYSAPAAPVQPSPTAQNDGFTAAVADDLPF